MKDQKKNNAIKASDVPSRVKPSSYPEGFAARMLGRDKKQLGDIFGLKNFGVNLTRLAPHSESSLFHKHSKQDEFIFILEGTPTLIKEDGETLLEPGMCAGFPAGKSAHQLVNKTASDVLYIEVGDRSAEDVVSYPNDDLKAALGSDGKWIYTHKDGQPY